MKLLILGTGPLAEQAVRLAEAAGMQYTLCGSVAQAGVLLPEHDYILPATEEDSLLTLADGEKALFGPAARSLTRSRLAADAFMREHDIPIPAYFPDGSEPYLVKPDKGSFGMGIWVTEDFCEVGGAVNAGFVTQEELDGDERSAVVIGSPGGYRAYTPARLTFAGRTRTGAVCQMHPAGDQLRSLAVTVAQAIGVTGVLEVEAIHSRGQWKVTDLNARIPMFTPDALLGEGVNILEEMIKA